MKRYKKGDKLIDHKSQISYKVYEASDLGIILIDEENYDLVVTTNVVTNLASIVQLNYDNDEDMEYLYSRFI